MAAPTTTYSVQNQTLQGCEDAKNESVSAQSNCTELDEEDKTI